MSLRGIIGRWPEAAPSGALFFRIGKIHWIFPEHLEIYQIFTKNANKFT